MHPMPRSDEGGERGSGRYALTAAPNGIYIRKGIDPLSSWPNERLEQNRSIVSGGNYRSGHPRHQKHMGFRFSVAILPFGGHRTSHAITFPEGSGDRLWARTLI